MASTSAGAVQLDVVANDRPFKSSLDSLDGYAKGIGKKIGAALSAVAVAKFGKDCLELASNLNEVQNVVDVTFSKMAGRVDEWAKGAAGSFGLSETMAKRYAGTFGSMAEAFGFTEKQAYSMSTALAGLAGDVASFYNIDQDLAYTKLKSVFSGETETLKDLGIVMTQSALDAYAMANGFGKTTKEMTEQEKVALRYSFVQQQLANASGDFARTSGSWANQTRLLQLRFDSLKATLGQGLIAAMLPLVKVMNAVILGLTRVADAFNAVIERLTGKSLSELTGGSQAAQVAVDDLGGTAADTAGSTDDLASAQKEAAGAAKKQDRAQKALNRTLAGFDKINKLTKKQKAEKTSSAGAAGAGAGTGMSDQVLAASGIADSLAEANRQGAKLKKIELPPALEKSFTRLSKAVGPFVDLMKSGGKWVYDNVLKPLGSWTANTLAPKVVDLLAQAFRVLTAICKALAPVFKAVWNAVFKPLAKLAGKAIAAALDSIAGGLQAIADFAEEHPKAFQAVTLGLTGLFAAHKLKGPFAKMITWMVGGSGLKGLTKMKWGPRLTKVGGVLKKVFAIFGKHPIAVVITAIAAAIAYVYKNWDKIRKTKVGKAIERLGKKLKPIAEKLGGKLSKVMEKIAKVAGKIWEALKPIVEKVLDKVLKWAGDAATALGDVLCGVLDGLCESIDTLGRAWDNVKEGTKQLVVEAKEKVAGALDALGRGWDAIKEGTKSLVANVVSSVTGAWETVKDAFATAAGWAAETVKKVTATVAATLSNAWETVKGAFSTAMGWASETARNVTATVTATVSNAWDSAKEAFGYAAKNVKNFSGTVTAKVSATVNKAWSQAKSAFKWAVNGVRDIKGTITAKVGSFASGTWKTIKKAWDWANKHISSIKATLSVAFNDGFTKPLKTVWNNIAGAINKGTGTINKITGLNIPKLPTIALAQGGYIGRNTPRLAVIGDNRREGEIVAPESKLQKMADDAAGADMTTVEALLRQLIDAVQRKDMSVSLDGRVIARSSIRYINGQTQATGVCPIRT